MYSAVGYAASNAHMLVGAEEVVIIDTTESTAAAENVLAAFREITDKPIRTIIYTHSHRDHISGASVFCEGGTPEIIASHLFKSDLVALDDARPHPGAALMERTKRQFGIGLSFPDERVSLGCGPGDRPMKGLGAGFVPPGTIISEQSVEIERAGWRLVLTHAPGETPDHLVAWQPDTRVLFSGDNFYHAFPNLYPIRGSTYRDFDAWADSLDLLMGFEAEVLAPGHTSPVFGAEAIAERLSDYRDAIRDVVRQTAEALNAGLGYDAAVEQVRLPEHLARKPWLVEMYGKVAWAARAYAVGTLGWYDGNPTNLARLPQRVEAERFVELAGGYDAVLAAARGVDDPQWALELVDRLIVLKPDDPAPRQIKVASMRALAAVEINPTARNAYLLVAQQMEADL